MKKKLLSLLIASCALSNVAWADMKSVRLLLSGSEGHISCTVNGIYDGAFLSIEPYDAKVQSPLCFGHEILITKEDLNKFAYKWKKEGNDPMVIVRVSRDGVAKEITCRDTQEGRPEAPGGYCLFSSK